MPARGVFGLAIEVRHSHDGVVSILSGWRTGPWADCQQRGEEGLDAQSSLERECE